MIGILGYIILLASIAVLCEITGQFYAHRFVSEMKIDGINYYPYLIITIICYFIISFILASSYEFEEIGTMNNLWSGFSIIGFTCFGYLIGEKITKNNIIGLIITLMGVSLLLFDSYQKDFSKK